MQVGTEQLIIFMRCPEAGRAKTRLIPALGSAGAASVAGRMAQRTIAMARKAAVASRRSLDVRFDGGTPEEIRSWLGPDLLLHEQGCGDLGERMFRAFQDAFASGARRVVIVGTDCPSLDAGVIEEAFAYLAVSDLVLGPASDGGYYLIGLSRPVAELFAQIPWGTSEVLDRTRRAAATLGLRTRELETLSDVDYPDDLSVWRAAIMRDEGWSNDAVLSIIVPALNEESHLGAALARIPPNLPVEIVVCDGGSVDRTREIASCMGARVIVSDPGRARQMNAGARVARGQGLVFLHADSLLPEGFIDLVCKTLEDPTVAAGAFAFRIDGSRRGYRIVEFFANFRSRRLSMPYGDQAIFMRREKFDLVGGYPIQPIMEDYAMVKKLHAAGRIVTLRQPVLTSARRWARRGMLSTTLLNQAIIGGYLLGVAPERLARWYRH